MITNQDLLEYSVLEAVLNPLIKAKKVLSVKEMDEVFESLITESKAKKLNPKLLNKGYAKHINTLTKKVTQDFVYDFYFLNHQPTITSKKSATPQPISESATTEFPYSITFTYGNGGFICEEFGMIPEEIDDPTPAAALYRAIDEADIFDTDWEMEEDEVVDGVKISTEDGGLTFIAEVETDPVDPAKYTISRTIDEYLNYRDGSESYDKGAIECNGLENLIQELTKWKDAVNKAIGNINAGRKLDDINLNEETEEEKAARIKKEDEAYKNIPQKDLDKAAREISGNHSARAREQYAKQNKKVSKAKVGGEQEDEYIKDYNDAVYAGTFTGTLDEYIDQEEKRRYEEDKLDSTPELEEEDTFA
jgi:hypothetical protein